MLEELEPRTVPSAVPLASPLSVVTPAAHAASVTTINSDFTPIEVQEAYGASTLYGPSYKNGTDGEGETIAIVDAYSDPNILADANKFSAAYNLPSLAQGNPANPDPSTTGPYLTIEQPGGKTPNNVNWAVEISLDVEWAHAMAPEANILLVEASSNSYAALMTAVGYAAQHANVVSMSWGGSEFSGETGAAYDSVFASYPNVTFVASAGDSGTLGGPEWPSSSPDVLAVGGTTLSISATTSGGATTYSIASQGVWNDGGGGVSGYETEPFYQDQDGYNSDNLRTTPDVSYDANPNSGVSFYDSYGYGGWLEVGGTSVGAPQWSAIVALADQARLKAGLPVLGTAQLESDLYGLASSPPSGTTYGTYFYDVTSGKDGKYSATSGYDLATGLGTPQVSNLVLALANTQDQYAVPSSVVGSASSPNVVPTPGPSGTGRSSFVVPAIEAEAASFLPGSDTTTVVAAAPVSVGAPASGIQVVVSAGTPLFASPWAGSAWQSGGGGGDAPAGDLAAGDQAAPAVVAPEDVGNARWLGDPFTEAVRGLKIPFTVPPSLSPAPPTNPNGQPAPMKGPSAPMPSGKGMGAIPLEKVELYAVQAAIGLVSLGQELPERRRRERLPEKPR